MGKRVLGDDNSGFSLIEVLVTLAIIAAVFMPLMAAFNYYSTSTRELKEMQRATTLAQNVMEITKAESMDDLKKNATFGGSTGALTGYTVDSAYEAPSPSNLNANLITVWSDESIILGDGLSSCYKDKAGNYAYRNRSDGIYTFVYKGVKDGVNEYDVVVTLDSSAYYSSGSKSSVAYNEQSLGTISGLDPKRTAVIAVTDSIVESAAIYFIDRNIVADSDEARNRMSMRLQISVEEDDSSDDGSMTLTAAPYFSIDGSGDEYNPCTVYQKTFSASDAQHLEKVYILYSPSTAAQYSATPDNIDFDLVSDCNLGIVPIFYIVTQSTSTGTRYLNITSSDKSTFNDGEIFSCIKGDLEVPGNMTGTTLKVILNNSTMSKLQWDPNKFVAIDSDMILSDGSVSVSSDKSDNRIYDVTVSVYKAGTNFTEQITTFTSTRRE